MGHAGVDWLAAGLSLGRALENLHYRSASGRHRQPVSLHAKKWEENEMNHE